MKQPMEKEDSEPAEMEKRPIQETPEGRIQALENENGTLEKQNKELKTRVLTLKKQVEALEEENINLISDKQTLESKIQALEKLLQQENKELKTRALTHKKQVADLVVKYKTLSSNQQNLDKEINDVGIKLEDLSIPENRQSLMQKLQEKREAVYSLGPQKPLDATAGHALVCNVDGKDKTEVSINDSQNDVQYTNEKKITEMVRSGQFSDLYIRSVNMAKQKKVITPYKDYPHREDEASVKMPASTNILGFDEHDESGEKFAMDNERIFNIAKDNAKNSSVQFPARFMESFSSYVKSIGAVLCDGIMIGTCFLVEDNWVLTNYHVYKEAKRVQELATNADNNRFPIAVKFDYFHHRQTEDFFIVEVDDDESVSQYGNSELDYKFMCLQEHEKLRDRVRLGTLVRTHQRHFSIQEQLQQVEQEIRQLQQQLPQQGPGQQEQQLQQRLHQNLQNKLRYQQQLQEQREQQQKKQLEQQCIQQQIQQQQLRLEQQQQQVHQEEQHLQLQEQQLQYEQQQQQQQYQQQQLQQLQPEQLLQSEELQQNQQEVRRRRQQLDAQRLWLILQKQQNQLQETTRDNRVILVGHPEGKEMQVEVCRIIGFSNIKATVDTRGRETVGSHTINAHLLENCNNQGCLAYDSTFYHGSSGSPAFNLDEKIVAMHTQGYLLWGRSEEKIYSLTEFGIQFAPICRDMREKYGDNVVNRFFPNSELSGDEETMDQS